MARETAAQRIQRIKDEKNGLAVIADIEKYSKDSTLEIDPEDIDRMKWYGLYTQNKNLQDKGDDGLYFMLRLKIEKGSVNVEQLRELSKISYEFARETATLTTRQNIQFHHIAMKDLPIIFARLKSVGLSSIYAAGDVPRNILTCPVMGIDHDEIIDINDAVTKLNSYFRGNKDLVDLPRKYKVGISACSKHCMGHEIQDLSFTAVSLNNEILFDVSVGGGLASNKQIASHLGYIKENQILEMTKAITCIYRDYGLRENRKKSRLGHLIRSWGFEKFKRKVEKNITFSLQNYEIQNYTPYSKREHFGIHVSKVKNKSYIGFAINGGHLRASGLENIANSLEKFGANSIKITNTQNFIVSDVPSVNAHLLIKELAYYNIDGNPSAFKARTISCTGMEFCKFAISETKSKAIELTKFLENRFPNFNDTLSVSLNGCPNSCAVPHVVDIGLLGIKMKNENGETVPGFELILGGNLEGSKSTFGEKTKIKILPENVNKTVEKLILSYIDSDYTILHNFMKEKINDEEFLSRLQL